MLGWDPLCRYPIARGARLVVLSGLLLVGICYSGRASDNLGTCAQFRGRLPQPKANRTLHGRLFPPEPLFRCAKSTFLCVFLVIVVCLRFVRCISTTEHKHPQDTMCHCLLRSFAPEGQVVFPLSRPLEQSAPKLSHNL